MNGDGSGGPDEPPTVEHVVERHPERGVERPVRDDDRTVQLPALPRREPGRPAARNLPEAPAGSFLEPPTIALSLEALEQARSARPTPPEFGRSPAPGPDGSTGDAEVTEPGTARSGSDASGTAQPDSGGQVRAEPAAAGRGEQGIGRASGIMALGTLASRATGFLRTVAITAALGTGLAGDAYNVANTTPNIVYDLLLGGVLTSVVVPVLARAAREDPDGGDRFASSLLTLVVVALTAITALGVLAAPFIVRLYVSRGDEAALATTFLRYFLPQVIFYGVGATIGAILNLRNRFAAPMATPVLNNLIVIATAVAFILTKSPGVPTLSSLTTAQIVLLGGGTTAGIVVMTVALLPSLRASGFRYRPSLDLRHPGLRSAARLAGWVLVFVVTSQVSYFVVTRLATGGVAYTTWFTAYQLFQLPHAIIAVSVITALLPRMSRHAADERLDLVRDDLSTGLRLAMVVIVPAALGLLVLANPICVAIFAHGATSVGDAGRIGAALAAFALALVPFSAFQLQLRAFYALADSRTPAFVNFAVAGTNIVTALVLSHVLPERDRAVALALAFALAYLVGAILCGRLLVGRLDGLDLPRLVQTLARTAGAGLVAAAVALLLSVSVRHLLGNGSAASLLAVVAGGATGAVGYLLVAQRMRIAELTAVTAMVGGRFGRSRR